MLALINRAWWFAAGQRALRTALVVLLPFLPAILRADPTAVLAAVSTVALAVVLSLATSLRSLPELDGVTRPWWASALDRAARTFAQTLIAGIPAVTLIQDIPWTVLLTQALASALGSVILAAIAALPETIPVSIPSSDVVALVTTAGHLVAGEASTQPTGSLVNLHAPARHLLHTPPEIEADTQAG
jgi:hypothetical protein